MDKIRKRIKQWLDANVWDGEDRSGSKDRAHFDPDGLQDLVEECFEDVLASPWIPCAERLPTPDSYVLIVSERYETPQLWHFTVIDGVPCWDGKVAGKHWELREYPVLGWMELPEMPTGLVRPEPPEE